MGGKSPLSLGCRRLIDNFDRRRLEDPLVGRPVLELAITSLVALVLTGSASDGYAQVVEADAAVACPMVDGHRVGPFVRNKATAQAIYRAVVRPAALEKYPIIEVEDRGDHWHVSQTNEYLEEFARNPPKPPAGYVIVQAGGGQISLDIDKCTAAISNFNMNK
jgi:hypothetical protein